jgi:hypothetical protein
LVIINIGSDVFLDEDNIHSSGENIITPIIESDNAPKVIAQYNGGANICMTNKVSALWNLHKLDYFRLREGPTHRKLLRISCFLDKLR